MKKVIKIITMPFRNLKKYLNISNDFKNPKISVVVPIYNVEKYLSECLDSILNQTFKNFELICVNDKSPDNTAEILEKYKILDNRIVVVTHEVNQGLGPSRNTGISIAKGKYIMFVDSDDYLHPHALEDCLSAMKKEDADIVQFMTQRVKDSGKFVENPFPEINNYTVVDKNLFKLLPGQNSSNYMPVSAWGKLFKTQHFKNNKFPHLVSEDIVPPYTILLTKAKKVVFLDKIFYFYRLNILGISRISSLAHSNKTISDHFSNYSLFLKLKPKLNKKKYKAVCHTCNCLFHSVLSWNLNVLSEKDRLYFLDNDLPNILNKVKTIFFGNIWVDILKTLLVYYQVNNLPRYALLLEKINSTTDLERIKQKKSLFKQIKQKITTLIKGKRTLILTYDNDKNLDYIIGKISREQNSYKVVNPKEKKLKRKFINKFNVIIDNNTFFDIPFSVNAEKYILFYSLVQKYDNEIIYRGYTHMLSNKIIDKSFLKNKFLVFKYIFLEDSAYGYKYKYEYFILGLAFKFIENKTKFLLIISEENKFCNLDFEEINNYLADDEVVLIYDKNQYLQNFFFSNKIINVNNCDIKQLLMTSNVIVFDDFLKTIDISELIASRKRSVLLKLQDYNAEINNSLDFVNIMRKSFLSSTTNSNHVIE